MRQHQAILFLNVNPGDVFTYRSHQWVKTVTRHCLGNVDGHDEHGPNKAAQTMNAVCLTDGEVRFIHENEFVVKE